MKTEPATARNLLLAISPATASLAGYTVETSRQLARSLNLKLFFGFKRIVYTFRGLASVSFFR